MRNKQVDNWHFSAFLLQPDKKDERVQKVHLKIVVYLMYLKRDGNKINCSLETEGKYIADMSDFGEA